jgi:hypothetical protein
MPLHGDRPARRWRAWRAAAFVIALTLLGWHGWSRLDHRPLRVMQTPVSEAREVLRSGGRTSVDGDVTAWSDDASYVLVGVHQQDGPVHQIASSLRVQQAFIPALYCVRVCGSTTFLGQGTAAALTPGSLLFWPGAWRDVNDAQSPSPANGIVVSLHAGRNRAASTSELYRASETVGRRIETLLRVRYRHETMPGYVEEASPWRWSVSVWRRVFPVWALALRQVGETHQWRLHAVLVEGAIKEVPLGSVAMDPPPSDAQSLSPTANRLVFTYDGGLWLLRLRKPLPELVKEAERTAARRGRQVP